MKQPTATELRTALRITRLIGTPEAGLDLKRIRDRKTTWLGGMENSLRDEIDVYLRTAEPPQHINCTLSCADLVENAPLVVMNENDLPDTSPLWCINEQIKGLLEGEGATEDHVAVEAFLLKTGLPRETVRRIQAAIASAESK